MALSGAAVLRVAAVEPVVSAATRLLVVAPHPDDETLSAALLMQRVHAAGGAVRVLLLTDGDDNPWPQRWLERRVLIRAADRARWGRRRRAEMHAALACLGLPDAVLVALGWPDLGLAHALFTAPDPLLERLQRELQAFAPDLVVLPALADRHPDHGTAHVLLRLALRRAGLSPRLVVYGVHGLRFPPAAAVPPATSAELARRQAALAAHRSQWPLGRRRLLQCLARSETLALPAPARDGDTLPWRPPPWIRPALRLGVVDAGGSRCWRWCEAPLQSGPDGWRLGLEPGPGPRFVRLELAWRTLWIFDAWGWCELLPATVERGRR